MNFFSPTSNVDIMNTAHQRGDSFFTLGATKPPVRTAVDGTAIIDLMRRSPQLAGLLMFQWSLHPAEPRSSTCRAEESPAPTRPTPNHLSPPVTPRPLRLFASFRSSWASVSWGCFRTTQDLLRNLYLSLCGETNTLSVLSFKENTRILKQPEFKTRI